MNILEYINIITKNISFAFVCYFGMLLATLSFNRPDKSAKNFDILTIQIIDTEQS